MQQYDVIVIGAGPSGAIASKTCAGNGLKTLLFEKEGIPRLKLCGGAVSTSALSDLDFGIKKDLIERECYGARVHFKNHQIEVKRKSRLRYLYRAINLMRTSFQKQLTLVLRFMRLKKQHL